MIEQHVQKNNETSLSEILSQQVYQELKQTILKTHPTLKDKLTLLKIGSNKIIGRPKQIINLFECQQLKGSQQKQLGKYCSVWNTLLNIMVELLQKMPLNANLIYSKCYFNIPSNKKTADFVSYIITKVDYFLSKSQTLKQQQNNNQVIIQKIQIIIDKLIQVFGIFIKNCSIRESSIHPICRILCNRYHQNQLSVHSLEIAQSFLQQTKLQPKKPNANLFEVQSPKPFIFFDGLARIGLRILLTNNKWPFQKGLHLCMWLKNIKTCENNNKSMVIFNLRTDDNKSLRIIKQRQQLAVECISQNQKSYRKVCDFFDDTPIKLEIILDSRQSGLFKSNQYQLHIGVNGVFTKNIEVKVPKFPNTAFITQFNLLENYCGQFYSLTLASKTIVLPHYLLSEEQISSFVENNSQLQSIITILSPMRIHKGIIINQFNSQQNHACHQATQIFNQVTSLSDALAKSEISLVLLYFCCCLYQLSKSAQYDNKISSEDKKQLNKLFNKILVEYCSRYKFTKCNILNNNMINPQLSNLFILYFLQVSGYPITQVTLNNVIDYACIGSLSGNYLIKYIDFYGVLTNKGLNINKALVNYKKKVTEIIDDKLEQLLLSQNNNSKLSGNIANIKDSQITQIDPVTKLQLLFLLQTEWKRIWRRLQYTCQWWIPNICLQNDLPFEDKQFVYKSDLQQADKVAISNVKFEWVVSQFITNDFCDCMLLPQIQIPKYGNFNNFRDMYIKKQCMSEDFNQLEISQCFLNIAPGAKIKRYEFKQVSKSIFGKIRHRLTQNKQTTSMTQVKQIQYDKFNVLGRQKHQIYFSSNVSYINLLTLFQGTISIQEQPVPYAQFSQAQQKFQKSGIITFHPRHNSKLMDHLCVKSFKNQYYPYIRINTCDVKFIRKRRYNQSMNGMQIRLKSGINYLFYFYGDHVIGANHAIGAKNMQKFINVVSQFGINEDMISRDPYEDYLKSNYTIQWIDKQISTYQYLQYLNDVSGRSYSDITQYPVLPWIYVSNQEQAQLKQQQHYRQLTKNMGSIGPQERILHFLQKFQTVNETQMFGQYHFGTHYSSSAIIFNFLIRLQPFSMGAVTLQSGKFDCADRVFSSYIGSWLNATNSPTDIRELVPQIYLLPQMMINVNNYDFGLTQLKQRICNVDLPKWAKKNPFIFCTNLRKALQNKFTTDKIKNWIDLIYGYKQKGKAAVESMNIYFPLTYQLAINVDKISDSDERTSIETQIAHFGQNPAQIIGSSPHPDRRAIKQKWQDKLMADGNQLVIQRLNLSKMTSMKEQKFIYESVFEDKNSVLAIKFITDSLFLVVRRYQFLIFRILDQKIGFISKQKQIDYTIQKQNISLDYLNIQNVVPMVVVQESFAIIGGFYDGNLQIIFLKQVKYSGNLKLSFRTISALAYDAKYDYLYVGDCIGYLGVYKLNKTTKDLALTQKFYDRVHTAKINCISTNHKANLFVTASEDGSIKLFNLYSQQMYRKIINPSNSPVIFANISTCPLYCLVFYSLDDSKIYSYSINGQYLASRQQPTGFIYNLSIQQNSQHTQFVISLNAHRQIYIDEMPFLNTKKKIRLKKDSYRISCFELTRQIAIAGSQDGGLQIIADPSSF